MNAVVTTDIEAQYAFHCGAYEQCYQLSQLTVISLLDEREPNDRCCVPLCGNMTLLIDDNLAWIATAGALAGFRDRNRTNMQCTQLTLSLYLLVKCKFKLEHPVKSLVEELDRIPL